MGVFIGLDVSLAKTAVLSTATAGYCGTPRYRASRSRWSNAWQSGPVSSISPGSRPILCRNGYTGVFARRVYRSCALRRVMPSAFCPHVRSKQTGTIPAASQKLAEPDRAPQPQPRDPNGPSSSRHLKIGNAVFSLALI